MEVGIANSRSLQSLPLQSEGNLGYSNLVIVSPLTPQQPNVVLSSQKSSCAFMVNPNGGAALKFIPGPLVGWIKCAKIEPADTIPEINYWQLTVLCTILGANPPLKVIEGFVHRIWAPTKSIRNV